MVLDNLIARIARRFVRHDALMDLMSTWSGHEPMWPDMNFETTVRQGYRKNELLFACINKTASTARMISLEVVDARTDKILDSHPVRALLKSPNPYMNESDFWASVHIYQKLAGVAYYEKERSASGRVVALWPLRPDWLKPKTGKGGLIAYTYQPPGVSAVMVDKDDILSFRIFDPLSQFAHYPPAAVAMRAWSADNAVGDWFKLFLDQGGVPPGLLKILSVSNDAEIARIRAKWKARYGGVNNWLQPVILDVNADYQRIGANATEIGTDIMDARAEARICMIMEVPPIIVGAKVGLDASTYSNYELARLSWWEDSLIPAYENHIDVIENQLLAEFGENLKVRWNYDRVPALRRIAEASRESALAELKAGAITRNQYNERVGLPQLGPAGEVYLLSVGVTEVPAKRSSSQGAVRVAQAAPSLLLPGTIEDDHDQEHPIEMMKRVPPDNDIRLDVEQEIADKMEDYFGDLLKRIKHDLTERGFVGGVQ